MAQIIESFATVGDGLQRVNLIFASSLLFVDRGAVRSLNLLFAAAALAGPFAGVLHQVGEIAELVVVRRHKPHTVFAEKRKPSPHRVADRGHFGGRQVFVTIVACL